MGARPGLSEALSAGDIFQPSLGLLAVVALLLLIAVWMLRAALSPLPEILRALAAAGTVMTDAAEARTSQESWVGQDSRVMPEHQVTIGIVTALPVEENAMEGLIQDLRRYRRPPDRNSYLIGTVPSSEPGKPHRVALVMLPRDGTRSAATCCSHLLQTFPTIRTVIMTGIAGGIPRPELAARHVRLGDVVVAVDGIVSYGSVRQDGEATRLRQRQSAGLVSSWLLRAAGELQVMAEHGDRPWERWLDPARSAEAAAFPRPPERTDVLYVRNRKVIHPPRPSHGPPEGMPAVHYGVVGSADVLLVDEDFRDRLAGEHPDIYAIEMEGAGIAASTAAFDRTWFMVRGVADYCERNGKNDLWQPYTAYAAASYVRALLEIAPPMDNLSAH